MDKKKTPRRRLSAEERKGEILEKTFGLICEKGFKSITTREIAKAAGINEALIYNYFPTKEALLSSVITEVINKQPVQVFESASNQKEFEEKLIRFVNFFISSNIENAEMVKVILYAILDGYPMPNEFDISKKGTFLNWLYESIEEGKRSWGFNQKTSTLIYISTFMGGLIYYLLETTILKIYREPLNIDEFKENYVNTFLKSLAD